MTEEQIYAILGRLYIALLGKDNEIKRLQMQVSMYESRTQPVVMDDDEDIEEN